MELLEPLINIGLNEKEAKVYLALLAAEKATAYYIATQSGLKKPTTYVILESLVKKGFVLKIPQEKKWLFMARSPKECFAVAQERFNAAKDYLPELLAIQKEGEEKVNVSYFEGLDGIKSMYANLTRNMKKKPEENRHFVGFFANQKNTPEALQKYWLELNVEFSKLNIKRKVITTAHPSIAEYLTKEAIKKFGVILKALPENNYSSNVSIEVYDNFTQIISHKNLSGILIENSDIANVIKQIFELVWNLTKEKAVGS